MLARVVQQVEYAPASQYGRWNEVEMFLAVFELVYEEKKRSARTEEYINYMTVGKRSVLFAEQRPQQYLLISGTGSVIVSSSIPRTQP